MRIPLIEYTSVEQKDGSRRTVPSYESLSIPQEDFIELKERIELINLLKDRSDNYCKNCKEKEKKGCKGCFWGQLDFHVRSAYMMLDHSLMALGRSDIAESPDKKKMRVEELKKRLAEYTSVTGHEIEVISDIKEPKWRIKNGTTK